MKKILYLALIIFGLSSNLHAAILPLQVGQIWEYSVTDSRDSGNPYGEFLHILELIQIDGEDFFTIGTSANIEDPGVVGNVFINSDDAVIYLWDDGVYDELLLSEMAPIADVDVPYGVFDAFIYDDGDFDDYYAPGVGYIKWVQFEPGYTITGELVAITSVPIPAAAWLFGSALIGLIGIKRTK